MAVMQAASASAYSYHSAVPMASSMVRTFHAPIVATAASPVGLEYCPFESVVDKQEGLYARPPLPPHPKRHLLASRDAMVSDLLDLYFDGQPWHIKVGDRSVKGNELLHELADANKILWIVQTFTGCGTTVPKRCDKAGFVAKVKVCNGPYQGPSAFVGTAYTMAPASVPTYMSASSKQVTISHPVNSYVTAGTTFAYRNAPWSAHTVPSYTHVAQTQFAGNVAPVYMPTTAAPTSRHPSQSWPLLLHQLRPASAVATSAADTPAKKEGGVVQATLFGRFGIETPTTWHPAPCMGAACCGEAPPTTESRVVEVPPTAQSRLVEVPPVAESRVTEVQGGHWYR